jgi:outer membrane protein assembly factor BamB/tetratricopeptide (TPR) repeat protein
MSEGSNAMTMRRTCEAVVAVGLLAGLTVLPRVIAQQLRVAKAVEPPANGQPGEASSGITLPHDRQAKRRIEKAEELIEEKAWGEAARVLQFLLDAKEDSFLEVKRKGPDGKETTSDVSVRTEANRLLGKLPPEGLQFYELQFGAPAKARLAEAKTKGDPQILAEVAQRYLHTEAGAEATNLLGTYYVDRGRYLMAALCFERLLSRPGADRLPARTLFKAALAFQRAGDVGNTQEAWKKLTARAGRDGVPMGDQVVSLDRLRKELDKGEAGGELVASLSDWQLFRGSPSRSAQAHGGTPFLKSQWHVSTLPASTESRPWIENALTRAMDYLTVQRPQPVLPAFSPIAAGGKIVYRTYDGVYAVNPRKEGRLEWISTTDNSLGTLLRDPSKRMVLDQWLNAYLQFGPQGVFFENSMVGTLSSDGSKVYVVDDLALPPHPQFLQQMAWGNQVNFGALQDATMHSTLKAIDLESGKVVWELGGSYDKDDRTKDCYYLGPPLPLGGKLYVMTEKTGELALFCLDPPKDDKRPPAVLWKQPLAQARDKLQMDGGRRTQAVHLAYGEGILVCPTNAGAVLGVDLLSHSLVWAHSYREPGTEQAKEEQQQLNPQLRIRRGFVVGPGGMNGMPVMNMNVEWKHSAPAVQDGKVVFAAPDGSSVHCVSLRDGRLVWKSGRAADDLYLAGAYGGKVLIIGKAGCRALKLEDGSTAWKIDGTGQPSGEGVAAGNVYYLPVRATADTKEPGICAIDLEKGRLTGPPIKSRKKEVPGNLVFYEGDVISQGVDQLVAFPQLKVILAQIDEELKKDPKNPNGLTKRAELRLDRGDLQGAVDDLHTALANNPPPDIRPKTRAKLYETLTELLQRDFPASEKYLGEYRDLCKLDVPADADAETRQKLEEEQVRRKANFLCLLGKGRESQGRLVDAFEAYREYGELNGNKDLVSVTDDPSTRSRPDVWARGRIAAMIAKATPEQRKPLEDKIAEQWDKLRGTNEVEALRAFVALFGSSFAAGRQARLALAERLMADGKEEDLRDAQLQLLQLRGQKDDREAAGRAIEALARLMIRKGLLDHAAHYYRELGRDFAGVTIKDGKTGADFYNDLATDKRFLPYLEDQRQSWNGEVKGKEVPGNFVMQPGFQFEPEGELLPFFRRHRLVLEMNGTHLRVSDAMTNEEYWRSPDLPPVQLVNYNASGNARFPYHVAGHIAVLNLGHMVYAFDVVDRKKLWEWNLYGPGGTAPQMSRTMQDRDGTVQVVYQDGWVQRLGNSGPVEASYVCLHTRTGLVALDPARGTVLWAKTGVSPKSQAFGDADYVFLVETNPDGTAGATRAVRAQDGVSVAVPDFGPLYQRRLRVLGRQILLADTDSSEGVVLRLYDVLTGKDAWRRAFPAGSVVLKSEDPDLAGAIDADGTVTVVSLHNRKEVLKAQMKSGDVAGVSEANLLADRDQFYVAPNKPANMNNNPWGGTWPAVGFGLRSVQVNGAVYAFDRETGDLRWWSEVPDQMLVLNQFGDLPVVLFAAQHNKLVNNGANRFPMRVMVVQSIVKRSGKLCFSHEYANDGNQFYALNTDLRAGTVELVKHNLKVQHYLEERTAKR